VLLVAGGCWGAGRHLSAARAGLSPRVRGKRSTADGIAGGSIPPPSPSLPPPSLPPTGPGSPPIVSGPRDKAAVALTFDSNLTDAMIRELDTGKVASFDNTAPLTAEALPAIITGLRHEGMRLETVTQLLTATGGER
jgi:hypothetical protein